MVEKGHLKEYLKSFLITKDRKKMIKHYKMASLSLILVGFVLLTIGSSVFFIELSCACFILGVWAKSVAGDLKIELDLSDKLQQQVTVQQPVSQGTQSITQLQYCTSCGKELQPDWKFCGYCGKRLKKSGIFKLRK